MKYEKEEKGFNARDFQDTIIIAAQESVAI